MPAKKSSKKVLFGILGGVVVILVAAICFLGMQLAQKGTEYDGAREAFGKVAEAYDKLRGFEELKGDSAAMDSMATIRNARDEISVNMDELEKNSVIQNDEKAKQLFVTAKDKLPELYSTIDTLEESYGMVIPVMAELTKILEDEKAEAKQMGVVIDVLDGVREMRYSVNADYMQSFRELAVKMEAYLKMDEICTKTPRSSSCDKKMLEEFDKSAAVLEFVAATETYQGKMEQLLSFDMGPSLDALGDYLNGKKFWLW